VDDPGSRPVSSEAEPADIDARVVQARFVRQGRVPALVSLAGTVASGLVVAGAVGLKYGRSVVAIMELGAILAIVPVGVLVIGAAAVARCERPMRAAVAVCFARAMPWVVVPQVVALGATLHLGYLALPFTVAGAVFGVGAFIVRWAVVADRAALPAQVDSPGVAAGVAGLSAVVGFIPVLWPVALRVVGMFG